MVDRIASDVPVRVARPALADARTSIALGAGAAVIALAVGLGAARDPETMQDVVVTALWAVTLFVLIYGSVRRSIKEPWLRAAIFVALLLRLPLILAHLVVGFWILGGAADFPGYFHHGVRLGEALLVGDLQFFVEFGTENLNFQGFGALFVKRLLAFVYLVAGANWAAMFLFAGILSVLGSYLVLRAYQREYGAGEGIRFLAVALFFFPSLAFWTSLLGKDSWIFFSLGLATYGVAHATRTPQPRHVLALLTGLALAVLIRPAVGVVLILAAGAAVGLAAFRRLPRSGPAAILRPAGIIVLCVLVVGGVLTTAVSTMRQYASGMVGEAPTHEMVLALAVHKQVGLSKDPTASGSSLPVAVEQADFVSLLEYLPVGVFTFLFRPFVFEAHNATARIAALDATLLLAVVLLRARALFRVPRHAVARPFIMFCVCAFLFLTAGLSFESNFGAIVRHRAMVLPFLFVLLAVPRSPGRAGADRAVPGGDLATVRRRDG